MSLIRVSLFNVNIAAVNPITEMTCRYERTLMSSQLDLSIPLILYFLCLVGKNTTSGKFDCILMCWLSDETDFSEQVGKHECI